ncbi:MAG: tetratricopeptide repeat protein [Devosia sp.]
MFRRRGLALGFGVAMVALTLAGCSSFGGASLTAKPMQVADLPNIGSYTSDAALVEARGHFRNSDFGHSAALYKRVVELSPDKAEGYVGLGASYDQLRRFDLADRVYASLFKLKGGTVQYYNNLGYSQMLRGDLSGALKNFREAQKLDPENTVISNNLQLLADARAHA